MSNHVCIFKTNAGQSSGGGNLHQYTEGGYSLDWSVIYLRANIETDTINFVNPEEEKIQFYKSVAKVYHIATVFVLSKFSF